VPRLAALNAAPASVHFAISFCSNVRNLQALVAPGLRVPDADHAAAQYGSDDTWIFQDKTRSVWAGRGFHRWPRISPRLYRIYSVAMALFTGVLR